MILIIDNYDSFVYNLDRYFRELGCETSVVRNDALDIEEISQMNPEAIVISPGPCTPDESGISTDVVRHLGKTIPTLGVCLGYQCIVSAFGGKIIRAREAVHGRVSEIYHQGSSLFQGILTPFSATRYHSLVMDENLLPEGLTVTARTDEGVPMAISHQEFPVYGVQFHPESILTQFGHQILANFLMLSGLSITSVPEVKIPEQGFPDPSQIAFDYPPQW